MLSLNEKEEVEYRPSQDLREEAQSLANKMRQELSIVQIAGRNEFRILSPVVQRLVRFRYEIVETFKPVL